MNIQFPFGVNGEGRSRLADDERHIQQLMEQVLFTSPGERVNRPAFGTGLQQLVFSTAGAEQLVATRFMVQGALQQWLGDVIVVDQVDVTTEDNRLEVTIQYQFRRSQQRRTARLTRTG